MKQLMKFGRKVRKGAMISDSSVKILSTIIGVGVVLAVYMSLTQGVRASGPCDSMIKSFFALIADVAGAEMC